MSKAAPINISLRPAAANDEDFLVSVYGSTREQELAAVPWSDEQRKAFIKFQYSSQLTHYQTEYPDAVHSVILCDGQPVGRVYVDRRESDIRILDITLLSEHRGKGIGTPIIRSLMSEAAETGKTVSIHVDSFSASHRLFERLGFKSNEVNGFHVLYVWQPQDKKAE